MDRTRRRPSQGDGGFWPGAAAARRLAFLVSVSFSLAACSGAERPTAALCDAPQDCHGGAGMIAALPYLSDQAVPAALYRQARLLRPAPASPLRARIEVPERPLQCVPYARAASGVQIRGDARTWWQQAKGRYARSDRPAVGAVLVLKPRGASRGHVAVVTHILNEREIVVEHANWLNRGRIHKDTPVRDVSAKGDWSAVRVWYTPGQRYGARTYQVYGFILPSAVTAAR